MRTHHVTSRHITSRYCISLHHITSRYYIVSHHIHHITPRHHTYQVWLPLIHTFDRNDSLAALRAGKYSNIRMKGSSNEDVNSVNSPWRTALQATQVTATFGLTPTFAFISSSPLSRPHPSPSHPHTHIVGRRLRSLGGRRQHGQLHFLQFRGHVLLLRRGTHRRS